MASSTRPRPCKLSAAHDRAASCGANPAASLARSLATALSIGPRSRKPSVSCGRAATAAVSNLAVVRRVPLDARSGVEARRRPQARRVEEREQRPFL